jgi:hypothetical protein
MRIGQLSGCVRKVQEAILSLYQLHSVIECWMNVKTKVQNHR